MLWEWSETVQCLKCSGWSFTLAPRTDPKAGPGPARMHWRKPVLNLWAWSHQNNIWVFGQQSLFLVEKRRGERERKTDKEQSAKKCWSRQQPTQDSGEKRAARRQHQHRLCSHRSAGNYDNNAFPRQPRSDLVSKHSPFLKSPLDNIWYDYKVKILFKERPLTCL